MSLITDVVQTYLPPKRKLTPSGWISFNAVCCHHNGTGADHRQRGGIHFDSDSLSYHCFNCGFKASWQPGRTVSAKLKKLLTWLAVPDDLIKKCMFDALRLKDDTETKQTLDLKPVFFDKLLPKGAKPLSEWSLEHLTDDESVKFLNVLNYMVERNLKLTDYNWHWTDEAGFNDRLIIPFYYESRIVGYTARLCSERKTAKYISEQQPGYVFNLDKQTYNRNFVLVTEGPIDAICIDGVAVMSNEIGPQQRYLISNLQREVIVVPDRDKSGLKLVEQALEWGWSVSMPDWEPGIKDVNDAVKKYGKLYTLWAIANSKESNNLKIQLRMKKWI
jgi:hypothetical protein